MPPPIVPTSTTRPRRSAWDIQREVWFALFLREVKARIGGQWTGILWSLFEPLAHVAIIAVVIGLLRDRYVAEADYAVYLVTGLVPFFLFRHLTMRLMEGVRANRGLFAYRQVKPLDTLLSRATLEILINLVVYAISLGVLGWWGYAVMPADLLEVLAVHGMLALLGTSLGVMLAVLSHDRERLRAFVGVTMMPLYITSGVIFPLSVVPEPYLSWLMWNPLAHLVDLSRDGFFARHVPLPGVSMLYPVLFALTLCAFALALYRVERLRLVTR